MKKWILLLFFLPRALFALPADCEVVFSPKDQVAEKLIGLINEEKKSIKIAAYCFTHLSIASALVKAKERGVMIEVLIDPFSMRAKSVINRLVENGVPLFVWDHRLHLQKQIQKKTKRKSLMHDKFCIFGDASVWTGSFNFTYDGTRRHQENAVIIRSKAIGRKYLDQFSYMRLYESRPYHQHLAHYLKKKKEDKNFISGYPRGKKESSRK